MALKELLRKNLGYNEMELEELSVRETKFTTKGDDVLNVAFENLEDVKELHVRKAESRNDDIMLRNFIPPNFFDRYMALNVLCTERRARDGNLKTQLRFGKSDVEVFVKYRDEQSGFRKVDLDEFADMSSIPHFNHRIKWRKVNDKPPRRKVDYGANRGNQEKGKTTEKVTERKQGLIRANSNSTASEKKKSKIAAESSSSSSAGSGSDDEDDDNEKSEAMEETEEAEESEIFQTPAGGKTTDSDQSL